MGLAWQEMEAKTTTRQTRDGGRWMDHLVGGGGGAEEERRREVAPADRRSGPREIQQPQERIISAGEQEPPRTGPGPATGRRHAAGVHAHTLYILCLGLVYLAS